MTDIYSEIRRSFVMRRVRGKNTKPEKCMRSALHRAGYRFRLHRRDLPGKPDIVLPLYHTVIFVNGCFWHQHPGCKKATIPQSNRPFWEKKLHRTMERDGQNREALITLGWHVITIWECEIRSSMDAIMRSVLKELKQAARQTAGRGQ